MNRRSAALTLATVCLVLLFAVAFLVPVPYVVMAPGVTENTLGTIHDKQVISITGHRTYPTNGHLNMTTVSVTSPDYSVRLPQVLAAWFSSDEIVLPRDVVYPPNQSVSAINHENTEEMVGSQQSAVVAGLDELGIKSLFVKVSHVVPGTPAAGRLEVGDTITSVDGRSVLDVSQVVSRVSALPPGTLVHVGLVRSGRHLIVAMHTQANPKDRSTSRLGVRIRDDFHPPFTVDVSLGQDIGGPSAGLMFSLGIYDKLTPGPLAGGRFIAGTGEISVTGKVGEIGGIQQKMVGAYNAGARYFLVPSGNCSEAVDAPVADKMDLIRVSTLNQAVHDLKALDAGDNAAISRCGS